MKPKLINPYEVPYLVDPAELKALGIDPDLYFKHGTREGGSWAGWMLDRKKDSALIERLKSMTEQHPTVQ
jgi:hypothetical protein